MTTSKPIKWHGGKSYLAPWIIGHMPPHTLYREPFFGGGAVLFRKPCEGISEAVNDVDCDLTQFWYTMGDSELFQEFRRRVEATPLSEGMFKYSKFLLDGSEACQVSRAWAFFIRYRQSRQGLGKDFATPTCRTRRGMNENVSAWLSAVEGLPEAHARLKRVEIRNMDACEFIEKYDHADALFYCDPPYLHETRHGNGANKDYAHEMTPEDHQRLLECLTWIDGRFILSGYRSRLYDSCAARDINGWRRVQKQIDNKASSKKSKEKKTECLWMNY